MIIDAVCFKCKHLYLVKGMKCAAFPGGIPDPIATEGHDHTAPYPGDHGIRFEAGEPGAGRAGDGKR